jgi:uncharacterized membrane protein
LLLLQLTAYFSLMVRWGALPLALAVLFVFNTCVLSWLSIVPVMILTSITGSDQSVIMPIIYLGAVLTGILQFLILAQLRRSVEN